MTTAREQARTAALAYVDSRFNTGQKGALEHAADAASGVWEPLVKEVLDHIQRQYCETSTEELDRIEMIKKLTEALGDG